MFLKRPVYRLGFLPSPAFHLESDAITEYISINMVSARQRAVEPRGEARDEGDAVLDALRRMGYGDKAPASTYPEMLDYRL